MDIILQGILFGLALAVMAGPILFTLLQTGIEEGFRAGVKVGVGIWVSDLIYICLSYVGLSYLIELAKWDNFSFYMGIVGGIILLAVGIAGFFSKPIHFEDGKVVTKNSSTMALMLKGFMINTVNPFTLGFWMTTMTTAVLKDELVHTDVFLFFGAILSTVIITDCLKIYLADWIRTKMNDQNLTWIRRGGGVVFILFGIALIVRVAF